MENYNNAAWSYNFDAPSLNRQGSRALLPPGALSKAVGVDGRYPGEIRPFPGFAQLTTATGLTGTPDYFRYHSILRGNSSHRLNGFVIRSGGKVIFWYYDTSTTTWNAYTIEASGATGTIGSAHNGKFLYYVRENQAGKTIYWNGSAVVAASLGPSATPPTAISTSSVTLTGGHLHNGPISIAYRHYDSARALWSKMSARRRVDINDTTDPPSEAQYVSVDCTKDTSYDTIVVYRSVSFDLGGTLFDSGILYPDQEVTQTPGAGSMTITVGGAGSIGPDEELVNQWRFDPYMDAAWPAPATGVIAVADEAVFTGGPETATDVRRNQIRWSPLHEYAPETFPEDNIKLLDNPGDEILEFVKTDNALFAVSKTTIWQIKRIGSRLVINQRHLGRGVVSRGAAHGVGGDMVALTGLGFVLVDGNTGGLQLISALNGVANDDWTTTLSYVISAKDSVLGASFFVNTSTKEAVVIWHQTNTITQLQDLPFSGATSGLMPTTMDLERAFFIDGNYTIYYPNTARSGKQTILGLTGTVNGTASTNGTTSLLTDSTASFGATNALIGGYLYFNTGNNAGYGRLISANTGTTITTAAFPNTIALGDSYSVSPVVLDVRLWPLGAGDDPRAPKDLARRRVVTAVGAVFGGLTVDAGATAPKVFFQMYRQLGATPTSTAAVLTDAPDGTFVSVKEHGGIIEPGVKCMQSNVDFRLVNVVVTGSLRASRALEG